MLRKIIIVLKKAGLDSRGSASLEATIIMPVIILMLFGLAMFSMFIYQKFFILDTAAYTAKQRAATWADSGTGADGGNGLYWRLFNDYGGSVEVVNSRKTETGPELVKKKNREAEGFITDMLGHSVLSDNGTGITVEYKNSLLKRTVLVHITQDVIIPHRQLSQLLGTTLQAEAQSEVTEPAEYIRNVDIAAAYSASVLGKIKDYLWPADADNEEDASSSKLIASKASSKSQAYKIYHYPGCKHIAKIKAENLIEFDSVRDADQQGYYLCIDCAKRMSNYGN